jgi:c-di-GMP-binding flagellar brake protein YcgR
MIGIDAPLYNERQFIIKPGTIVRLKVAKPGMNITYDTEILFSDQAKKMIFVHYDEEATAMHLQKNFFVAPALPIPVRIIAPYFERTEAPLYGKILELSRVRATVFSEDKIPEDECLAVTFTLPDESEISSPIVVAVKKIEKFMYDLEFIVIDEKEKSKMIQYMFKRQIEMSKIDIN